MVGSSTTWIIRVSFIAFISDHAKTDDGKTPLDFAIEYKRPEVIALLEKS